MSEIEWMQIFGQNLQELMDEKGYIQRELADAIGVTNSTISRYIKGSQMPTAKVVVNLVYELDVSFEELIDFGSRIY